MLASHMRPVIGLSNANPLPSDSTTIDLTLDDEPQDFGRQIKRLRTDQTAGDISQSNSPTPTVSTPSPSSSFASIQPPRQYMQMRPQHIVPPQLPSLQSPSGYRPHFASNSSAFFPNRSGASRSDSTRSPPSTSTSVINAHDDRPQLPQHRNHHQVIDLTSSPSPPPSKSATPGTPKPLDIQGQPSTLGVPPKTPVCIGQLTVTALVLYPVPYLLPQDPNGASGQAEWAPVRLQYDPSAKARGHSSDETINIRAPTMRSQSGEIIQGENFGVIEQKVATVLGPMLGKGLIRLDAKVRKGVPNLPILPLQLLVHTPNGNIPIVSRYLQQYGLLLDHPSSSWETAKLNQMLYLNPHNPPPGGHARSFVNANKFGTSGPGANRWTAPQVAGKSVEVQRNQVDEVFKILRSGEELEETEPTSDIASKLYPHQKKALTFLLERERETRGMNDQSSSLWQTRRNAANGGKAWFNIVTQREALQEPPDCKGALLADDMGLGKTITCVSLIASTLKSAEEFAERPLPSLPKPPHDHSNSTSTSSLSASHFTNSVWGMPSPTEDEAGMSAKKKAKLHKEQDRWEVQYARARRLKTRSRATLIICPLSTVANWEDQFKEHWAGPVTVVGGAGSGCTSTSTPFSQSAPPSVECSTVCTVDGMDESTTSSAPEGFQKRGYPLRIYVYHGNARRPDPTFLADFDAVITTYATLASEFSKQARSLAAKDADGDDDNGSNTGEENGGDCTGDRIATPPTDSAMDVDENGSRIIHLPKAKEKKGMKRKKMALFSGAVEASSPLQSVYWFRVVLDEAHSIKETSTVGSRASCDLEADRRLCLTGTPVQNKLDDVFALIKFLRLDPFDDRGTWQEFIGIPVKFGQPLGVARLQTIMKCITLRRTKESKTQNGQKILSLPPRSDELRYLKFDEQEQSIYDRFFKESRAEFNELSHKNEVMKNYVGILQKILRLRQICDHYELVDGKGPSEEGVNYDEVMEAISREGINESRAAAIFSLIRETGTALCVECGYELGAPMDVKQEEAMDGEANATSKKGRKIKAVPSRTPTRPSSPAANAIPRIVMSRCKHLFCIRCFQTCVFPQWPNVSSDLVRCCSVCQMALRAADAAEVAPDCGASGNAGTDIASGKKKLNGKKEKRQKGMSLENFHPSTKVKALLGDLAAFSRANPYSTNYDASSIEVQMVDEKGNGVDDGIVKTVVFSQWTTMLDKVEDALEAAGIRYERLDGTMKRDERSRAMDALKFDPSCEVLLVSLKAGGVGLNLTSAQRVYLMDPYWNPAVENQAVDRIHRLGQTRPVTTVRLVIKDSIEERLLEVQKKKTELANMTLGQHLSKAEVHQRRIEELNQLFKS